MLAFEEFAICRHEQEQEQDCPDQRSVVITFGSVKFCASMKRIWDEQDMT